MLVPMGMAMGADVTLSDFLWKNLLPVTLGNIVAGGCLLACMCACMHACRLAYYAVHAPHFQQGYNRVPQICVSVSTELSSSHHRHAPSPMYELPYRLGLHAYHAAGM